MVKIDDTSTGPDTSVSLHVIWRPGVKKKRETYTSGDTILLLDIAAHDTT
jgi:hypothetical protein